MKVFLFAGLFIFIQLSDSEVLKKVWDGVGGKPAWEQSRYFQFSFNVIRNGETALTRHHLWDRYDGHYRLHYEKDGVTTTVLFNTQTKQGKVFQGDSELTEPEKKEDILKNAYSAYINDTYWLLSPVKLEDPGVNRSLLPDESIEGRPVYVLKTGYDEGVGLTPKDQYWFYIDQENGRIIRWAYLLQGRTGEPSIVNWEAYSDIGGLSVSLKKTSPDGSFAIHFTDTRVLAQVDRSLFDHL